MKAVPTLAKILETASCRSCSTGPSIYQHPGASEATLKNVWELVTQPLSFYKKYSNSKHLMTFVLWYVVEYICIYTPSITYLSIAAWMIKLNAMFVQLRFLPSAIFYYTRLNVLSWAVFVSNYHYQLGEYMGNILVLQLIDFVVFCAVGVPFAFILYLR